MSEYDEYSYAPMSVLSLINLLRAIAEDVGYGAGVMYDQTGACCHPITGVEFSKSDNIIYINDKRQTRCGKN